MAWPSIWPGGCRFKNARSQATELEADQATELEAGQATELEAGQATELEAGQATELEAGQADQATKLEGHLKSWAMVVAPRMAQKSPR